MSFIGSRRLIGICVALLFSAILTSSPLASANEDPFPGVADGAEVSQRQTINPRTGDPADGSAPIECPSGSGRSQVANATTKEQYLVCVKNWRPTSSINADREFSEKQEAARAAAQAESQAWNAANPGKQKCVQWGPIVHANGVSTASGGVCANPVEPGPSTTVASQDAPSVQAPPTTSQSSTGSTGGTSTPSSESSSATTSTSSSPTNTSSSTNANPSSSNSSSTTPVEDFSKWGSGTPYTKVLKGQLSTSDCPSGFQAANGVIAAIGVGTFTECWPENAWAAYRLGGSVWEQFKNSGGTYDAKAEIDRRNKVTELKSLAKSVAQAAADQTPGIQRCSRWTGYGESGQECAYTFVKPDPSLSPTSSTSPSVSDTKTATTSIGSPETSTSTSSSNSTATSTQISSNDPFPNLKNGEEIPGTRVTSASGLKQSEWEQTSVYKALICPSGSGRAGGVDLNFTVSQSDDRWFAYCVKSFQQSSTSTPFSGETSTATASTGTSTATSSDSSTATASTGTSTATSSDSSTATTSNSQSSSTSTDSSSAGVSSSSKANEAPTLEATAIKVTGTVSELKNLASSVVENPTEKRRLQGLLNKVDGVSSATSLKTIKLPGSSFFEESAESRTPDFCSVNGVSVSSLKKGICVIAYTITDSDGNKFTTLKEIFFRK
jgi:hypothetical protein